MGFYGSVHVCDEPNRILSSRSEQIAILLLNKNKKYVIVTQTQVQAQT